MKKLILLLALGIFSTTQAVTTTIRHEQIKAFIVNAFDSFFDSSAVTADRTYTLPDSSGTVALTSDLSAYKLDFSENTGFNKNFGTIASTVSEGDHLHTSIYEPANANIQSHISSTSNPHSSSIANLSDTTITTPLDDQVLTYSSGEWINASTGGGGSEIYWESSVCSSGCDYTTINGAVTAGKKRIVVTGSVTETSDTTMSSGDYNVKLLTNVVVTMNDNQFIYANKVRFDGDGKFIFDHSVKRYLFNSSNTSTILYLNNLTIENQTTGNNKEVIENSGFVYVDGITVDISTAPNSGLKLSKGFVKNITVVGNDTSIYGAIQTVNDANNPVLLENIIFNGTFSTTVSTMTLQANTKINNLTSYTDIFVQLNGTHASNFDARSNDIRVLLNSNDAILNNAHLGAGNLDIGERSNNQISNVTTTGSLDLTDASANNNKISNSQLGSITTVVGDNNSFENTTVDSTANFTVTGGHNKFSTVTHKTNGNWTINGTDIAIADIGTGSVVANNVVY